MALKALQHDAETRFSLEAVFLDEVFDNRGASAAKLAWVNGWRKLPHIDREVQRRFEYPQQFAEDIYNRAEHELSLRHSNAGASNRSNTGRLYIVSGDDPDSTASAIPELPAKYFGSSDRQIVAAQKAVYYDRAQLLAWRQEGHFLVSYETPGGWIALKKELLTDVLGAGRDARIVGLPLDAAKVLRLMCTDLLVLKNAGDGVKIT
jgi:hypothetical protein